MFKINKCITFRKSFPLVCKNRLMSCGGKCPPRYECKQPEPSEMAKQVEELMEMQKPKIFQCGHHPNSRMWKNIFCFLCVPLIFCIYINVQYLGDHTIRRPRFVEFSHMRIRTKQYVWDPVRTLFHNPEVNALPTGYEVEIPEENEYDPFEKCKK